MPVHHLKLCGKWVMQNTEESSQESGFRKKQSLFKVSLLYLELT